MRTLLFLAVLLIGAIAYDQPETIMRDLFTQWKQTYGKSYTAGLEEDFRYFNFVQNYLAIEDFNANDDSVRLGLNQFADLTKDEFGELYTGLTLGESANEIVTFDLNDLPASVDWRQQGAVTPVKNQGTCGSCWAFSAVGALEGLYFINNSKLVSFSEQNLVDCVTADKGCRGGWPIDAFSYTAQSGGIESEDDYPYVGRDTKCTFDTSKAYVVNDGYYNVTPSSEDDLKAAIVQQPVSVAIQANQIVFQFYQGGVIKRFCGATLDHGVLAVGYDTINGDEAYIVKNSWGGNWGNEGYVYISTDGTENDGKGVCGILSVPAIPYKN